MRPVHFMWIAPAFLSLGLPAGVLIAQQRPMTVVDLMNVPSIRDVQLSPDGTQLLYVRSDADWTRNRTRSHIWRVNVDGSASTQLTAGADSETSPRWSPDGSLIAFLARRDGERVTQIHLISNRGGEARILTRHPTAVSDIDWSPDGALIYFTAEDEESAGEGARERAESNVFAFEKDHRHRHLWRADAETGQTERITGGDYSISGFAISDDGTLILHGRAPSPLIDDGQNSELWLMTPAGEEARRLTDNGIREESFALSPDNSQILFVANSNERFEFYYNNKLFVMPAAGGTPEIALPDDSYDVNEAIWSSGGRSIYFIASVGVRRNLFRLDMANRRLFSVTEGDHTVGDWHYRPDLGLHAYTVSDPSNAGDIWTLQTTRRGEPTKVTTLFDDLTREFRLPAVEAVQWQGEDGVTVEGLLYYPLDYREGERYPLVVQTHGGPASSDGFAFFSSSKYVPVLASLGYMVLQPNYRGSTGYGDAFLRDMVGHYFNQAHRDVMSGVDHLIARGLADGDRLATMGWSAGGHMTNKLITYTDRFKAASSGAGAVNWISMYAQSDTRVYRTPWFGGDPWSEDAPLDQYWADSPLKDLWKVTTPTLILVGERDERVPMPQSVELYRALKANGVPTHLYVAGEQGHSWRELRQRLFRANVELDWFERWVTGREYVWEEPPTSQP